MPKGTFVKKEAPSEEATQKFRHKFNNAPYAFVELTFDEYIDTKTPEGAKWSKKNSKSIAKKDADEGVEIEGETVETFEQRTLPEYAPHALIYPSLDKVFLLLCASEEGTKWRRGPITVEDISDWDDYLEFVFGIQQSDWMTHEEVIAAVAEAEAEEEDEIDEETQEPTGKKCKKHKRLSVDDAIALSLQTEEPLEQE